MSSVTNRIRPKTLRTVAWRRGRQSFARRFIVIRVGLVGCGGIMGAHLPGWRAVEGRAQVTAACDVSEANAQRRAEEMGGTAKVYSDWKAMLKDDAVDAVDVALPHRLHRDGIVNAVE